MIPVTKPTNVSPPAWKSPMNHSAAISNAPSTPPVWAVCCSPSWSNAMNTAFINSPPLRCTNGPPTTRRHLVHGRTSRFLLLYTLYLLDGAPGSQHGALVVRPAALLVSQLVDLYPHEFR